MATITPTPPAPPAVTGGTVTPPAGSREHDQTPATMVLSCATCSAQDRRGHLHDPCDRPWCTCWCTRA